MNDHDLLNASMELIEAIEGCFHADAAFTQQLDFNAIQGALLANGSVHQANQWNIHRLHEAMARFREAASAGAAHSLDPRRMERKLRTHDRHVDGLYGYGPDAPQMERR